MLRTPSEYVVVRCVRRVSVRGARMHAQLRSPLSDTTLLYVVSMYGVVPPPPKKHDSGLTAATRDSECFLGLPELRRICQWFVVSVRHSVGF